MSEVSRNQTQVAAAIDAQMFTAPIIEIARVTLENLIRQASTDAERERLAKIWDDYMAGTGKFARFGPV